MLIFLPWLALNHSTSELGGITDTSCCVWPACFNFWVTWGQWQREGRKEFEVWEVTSSWQRNRLGRQ
jgi:cytochrome c oxidase assembly factor CtaG